MKYKKGSFVVVPNTEYLKGKPLAQQAIFFWLCYHADEDGICYPSRAKIGKEGGCDIKTVDKYIKVLVEDGAIEKTTRKKGNSVENNSNLYQILQLEVGNVVPQGGGTVGARVGNVVPQGGERSGAVTILNNYTQGTIPTADAVPKEKKKREKSTDPTVISVERLASRYARLFKDKYGFYSKAPYSTINKIFRELLLQYNETQLSYLLIVYFNWKGMTESNDNEKAYLEGRTHDLFTFKFKVNQYEAFARNVAGYSKEFDSENDLLPIISKYYTDLTNNNSDVKLPSLLQR